MKYSKHSLNHMQDEMIHCHSTVNYKVLIYYVNSSAAIPVVLVEIRKTLRVEERQHFRAETLHRSNNDKFIELSGKERHVLHCFIALCHRLAITSSTPV